MFIPLGEPDVTEVPNVGEVVYAHGNRVLTRHWNYRDADATKVTDASRNVAFIIERISASAITNDVIREAQDTLIALLQPHASVVVGSVIEPETPNTDLKADEPGFMI